MSDTPRRRLLDRVGSSPSLLAPRSRVTGDVETPGALVAGGEVIGDGHVGGELSLSAEASWQGELRARSAVIAGRLIGSITVSDTIEIAASAVIQGRVTARKIAMARGATIDGEVTVTGSEPILQFDERREPQL
ncbi:MAG TPA: polymer-forming cytoskeletal protein [Steroidobacteraceae bacterium]|nr:polymer-forming cytoskeletal protein [Steroidobacteraceae bacterium]